jgi:hypothetical protein
MPNCVKSNLRITPMFKWLPKIWCLAYQTVPSNSPVPFSVLSPHAHVGDRVFVVLDERPHLGRDVLGPERLVGRKRVGFARTQDTPHLASLYILNVDT